MKQMISPCMKCRGNHMTTIMVITMDRYLGSAGTMTTAITSQVIQDVSSSEKKNKECTEVSTLVESSTDGYRTKVQCLKNLLNLPKTYQMQMWI